MSQNFNIGLSFCFIVCRRRHFGGKIKKSQKLKYRWIGIHKMVAIMQSHDPVSTQSTSRQRDECRHSIRPINKSQLMMLSRNQELFPLAVCYSSRESR